jgi:hypothetical protein
MGMCVIISSMLDSSKETVAIEYSKQPDINENNILIADQNLLEILLVDQTTKKNILWMTDNYANHGTGYSENDQITIPLITCRNTRIIKPRINKSKKDQLHRVRDKAEVFTPSWICNSQNNLVDSAWFESDVVFNTESERAWITNHDKIQFPNIKGKAWQDYVLAQRLEISCGEAPYLVSRYDTTTGEMIPVADRIGLLDRKLRIVHENTGDKETWVIWSIKAIQSIYGYEWQGDSLLLARENILLSFIDHFREYFDGDNPPIELLREVARIVSWNLWQMDGIKYVIPCSCYEKIIVERGLFEDQTIKQPCIGCKNNDIHKHNGIYCKIKDWQKDKIITAVSMLKG